MCYTVSLRLAIPFLNDDPLAFSVDEKTEPRGGEGLAASGQTRFAGGIAGTPVNLCRIISNLSGP